jgi:hypothetical protein
MLLRETQGAFFRGESRAELRVDGRAVPGVVIANAVVAQEPVCDRRVVDPDPPSIGAEKGEG